MSLTATRPSSVRTPAGRPRRRLRLGAAAIVAVAGVVASSCTAPGQITLQGPWTIPLPPIESNGTPTTVPVIPGVCNIVYTAEGFSVSGVTVKVPGISIDVSGVINIPNVAVNVPAAVITLPGVAVPCLGASLVAQLVIPAKAVVQNAQLNLNTGVLTLQNPSVTITGVGLRFPGLGGLTIPTSITIPVGTVTVPL